MDGTLVDSEKLWDVGMHALYGRMGGVMTEESREATVGGSAESVMLHTYRDLGLEPDPAAITMSIDWLHAYVGELFEGGLPGATVPANSWMRSTRTGSRWPWSPTPVVTSPRRRWTALAGTTFR